MSSKALYFLSLLSLLVWSCAEPSKKSEPTSQDPYSMESVMAVHDEVMPKMSEIARLIDELKPLSEKNPDSPYTNAIAALQKSHKAMMDWMGDIGEAFTPDEILKGAELSEEKKARLKLEAERINEVKTLMLNSIQEGKRLIEAVNAE